MAKSRDGEHEIVQHRIIFGLIVSAYAAVVVHRDVDPAGVLRVLCAIYLAGSFAILLHARRYERASRLRRLVAVVLDIGVLSCGIAIGGEVASPFWPVYLWITLGHGFRFGVRWLRLASMLTVAGFGAAVITSPFWRANPELSLGLLAALIAIPLYAQKLIIKLSKAKREAEAANDAKSMLLARVSHELRTPLNAVIGMSDLIGSTRLDAEQRDMASTINASGQSLLALIDDILDVSRLDAGKMPFHAVPFDLKQLLADVVAISSVAATEKNLRLSFHITSRTPLDLVGDIRHLREILLNLCSNAVKFTTAGSVVIAADAYGVEGATVELKLEVSDTGIGMTPASQLLVFDEFSQADHTILSRFGGTGLGLSITRRLVQLMGGEITVASAPQHGSTFRLNLKLGRGETQATPRLARRLSILRRDLEQLDSILEQARLLGCQITVCEGAESLQRSVDLARQCALVSSLGASDLARDHAQPTALHGRMILVEDAHIDLPSLEQRRAFATIISPRADDAELRSALRISDTPTIEEPIAAELQPRSKSMHVLVAEDNSVNQKVVRKILERAGHTVELVATGEQALDALAERRFDLVLMDLNMPGMDGIDAVRLLRFGTGAASRIPVIGLTADATQAAQDRCLSAGMDRCLYKPIEPKLLLDTIDQFAAPPASQPAASTVSAEELVPDLTGASELESITSLADHPRFRPIDAVLLDRDKIRQLEALGGPEFLNDLINEFLNDSTSLLASIADAMACNDAAELASLAHALLSASGNMGAEHLSKLLRTLLAGKGVSSERAGKQRLASLQFELDRVRQALRGEQRRLLGSEDGQVGET